MLGGSFNPHLPQAGKGFFFMSHYPHMPLPESLNIYIAPFCYIADSPPETNYASVKKPIDISLRTATTTIISERTGHQRPSTREFYQIVVQTPSPKHAQIGREHVGRALQEKGIIFADGHSQQPNVCVIVVNDPHSMHDLAKAVTSGQLALTR